MFEAAPANSVDGNGNFTGQLPRHFIKPASLETTTSANDTLDAILSPYVDVYAKGDDPYGFAYGYLSEFAAPIQMTYPNVFARPDLGDGQNQFVYTSDPITNSNPNPAVLSVPADIQALGANEEQMSWLLIPAKGGPNPRNQGNTLVDWNFDEHSAATNSLMAVQTPGEYRENYTLTLYPPDPVPTGMDLTIVPSTTDIEPPPNDNKNHHSINFHGLPETPAEYLQRLGNHTVTLNVSTYTPGQPTTTYDSAVAYFQAFFNGLATNHPNGTGDPNWWYYYTGVAPYNQWSPFQDPTGIPGNGQFNPTTVANYPDGSPSRAFDPSDQVQIHNDAYSQQRMRVFDIDPNPVSSYPAGTFRGDANGNTLAGNFHVVRYIGYLELQGIYSYIAVTSHELGHVISYNKPYTIHSYFTSGPDYTHAPYIITSQNATGPDGQAPDTHAPYNNGFDDLWVEWKIEHHLNPYWSQTVSDQAYGKADPDTGRLTTDEVGISDPNVPPRKDAPDNEILADLPAVAALFENDGRADNFEAWKLDWADAGVNRADSFDSTYGAAPYFGARQFDGTPATGKTPVFYLRFVPTVAGYPTDGVTAFTPSGGPLANGAYGIESLSQLREQYPNLVISIDDLGRPDTNFIYNP